MTPVTTRAIDVMCIALLACGSVALALGVRALGDSQDLAALFWLAAGGLVLRAATNLVAQGGRS